MVLVKDALNLFLTFLLFYLDIMCKLRIFAEVLI